MMNYKDALMRYTLAAQAIVYDSDRATSLLKMMTTMGGTTHAVRTVMAAIGKAKPVQAELAPLVGVMVLMLLVDLGFQVSGKKPKAALLNKVIKELMSNVHDDHPLGPPPTQLPAVQNGLIGASA